MLNSRDARRRMRLGTTKTQRHKGRAALNQSRFVLPSRSAFVSLCLCGSLFSPGLPGCRFADSLGEFFLFGGNAKRFWNFHTRFQLNGARLGVPGFRICLRISNGVVELDRIVIHSTVALDGAHLITVRLTLRAEPGLFIKSGSFDHERVTIPFTDRITVPSRIRIVRKFTSVHPDFADRVLPFEKHQNPSRNVDDLKKPNDEQNTRDTHRVAFQDWIVAARRSLRAVSWLVRVVLCLSPRGQRREVVARSLTTSTRCKLPYSGQVMSVERRLRLRSVRHSKRREYES